jgi:catechol 2,3-dioxygenase-like lactoylglutathione lyase family enzyme
MSSSSDDGTTRGAELLGAVPQVFVSNLAAARDYYVGRLGFVVAFLYGEPPFYGEVRRGGARLNLRHVDEPVVDRARAAREDLLTAAIPVEGVSRLHDEFRASGATFHQPLRKEPWGAWTFIVADPDGNLLLFAGAEA